jgi:hypothetical protein
LQLSRYHLVDPCINKRTRRFTREEDTSSFVRNWD